MFDDRYYDWAKPKEDRIRTRDISAAIHELNGAWERNGGALDEDVIVKILSRHGFEKTTWRAYFDYQKARWRLTK